MKFKKFLCAILSFVCMICFGLGISLQTTNVAKAEAPTVALSSVDTEYNNTVWGGTTMAVGLMFDKNFTAKAYDANEGSWEAPVIAAVKSYTKINGQGNVIQLSFLVEENANRIVFLYDNSLLTVPEGQEYTTFTIEAGAPFGGEYLPAITLYLVDGKWQATEPVPDPDPVEESVTVTKIHNRNGGDQKLLIFISNSDYETANTTVDLSSVNVLDYVNVYTSETEYKTLREIYQGNAQAKVWGEANALGFQIDGNYHGTAVYAVEIKAGAQFPATANSYTTYVVSETITYYNNDYQSTNAELNGWAVSWTTVKPVEPETPVEPDVPEIGTPSVAFTNVDTEYNNFVWGGTTMALGLMFDKTFTAKAYDANEGGWEAPVVATVKKYTKINGQGGAIQLSFLVEENANRIVFLYDSSLLTVPEGQEYTTFTIEEGVAFGGEYLPAITLYFVEGAWQSEKPAAPETPVEPDVPAIGTPSVALTSVDTEYNNTVWGGTQMAVGLKFDKNFTAKAYDANEGSWDAPVIAAVRSYTKINGQSGVIQLSFLVEENANRIVFLYDNSLLTVPEGQEYTTFTIEEGAPFGGEYLPAITLYFVEGKWQATEPVPEPDPVEENVTVTNIHNRNGGDQKLLIFISNSDYADPNTTVDLSSVNVLDSVNVYTSETEYKTLREIYQGNAQAKVWGEANSLGFTIDANYHGTAVYAVEIKAGAEFPAATNSYTTYVVSADVIYYNNEYKSANANPAFAVSWTTIKPETPVEPDTPEQPDTPVEPEAPVEPGTPDVEFVGIYNDNNNSVWGGTTRALRLVFSENFTAKAYDGNNGGFDATVIAALRNFVKINGKSLGNLTFLQVDNENSITILYDESLLSVASGTKQTVFTIEEGAPFGGRYLPAVTLYFNGETWQTEAIDIDTKLLGIVATQNNTSWDAAQNSVRLQFNYSFNNTTNYNINDADGLNMLSKLTFNGVALTEADILIFTEDIAGNTVTMVYKKALFDTAKEEGMKYHTLALTESVTYLGVEIPAFTLYLRNDAWITEMLPIVEMVDVETAVGYNTSSLIHIRDWNLDGDETTAVNNMIVFFLPSGGFPEEHNLFLNVDKVEEYNVFEKIKLHMITPNSIADADGFVTLSQVFNAGGWYPSNLSGGKDKIVVVNMWETVNSVAFSMGAEYTAESFDYIIIEEGCEFPNYYYTNKLNVDYVQNGESVDYESLEKVSFWQTQTVKMFTNPTDFQGPSLNTNWGINTNMGEITVSGVDYADGYVIIQLENSNYPTEADGDNLNQNISAGNVPMALNMLADIYVNGISLYDRVVHFGGNGITAYYNYNGYGNFAINVALVDANEVITEIIIGKDLKVPIYGMSDMAAVAYGTMYKEVAATISFSKGEQGFAQNEEIFWTVIFNDGENVKTVKVAHGEILAANDIPEVSVKEGYEFVAWVYGIDGMYTFAPTSNIASCYYLTATWKEVTEQPKDEQNSSEAGETTFGCFGAVSSMGAMASAMMLVGAYVLTKKKED